MKPTGYFLVRGVGHGENEIEAFENALRDAGVEKLNHVLVSSILPAGAKRVPPEAGIKMLEAGEISFCVMARRNFRAGEGSAAIAVAKGGTEHGYFVEISRDDLNAGKEARETARRLFVSKFGVKPSEIEVISSEATAEGETCVVACAVLLF